MAIMASAIAAAEASLGAKAVRTCPATRQNSAALPLLPAQSQFAAFAVHIFCASAASIYKVQADAYGHDL